MFRVSSVLLTIPIVFLARFCPAQEAADYNRAQSLLSTEVTGALATISASEKLQPNTSLAPYIVDRAHQRLIFYLQTSARHSRNIAKNPRASFMVSDTSRADPDPGNRARLTFNGTVVGLKTSDPSYKQLLGAYFASFPKAKEYQGANPDQVFQLYELKIADIFFIGSYGHVFPLTLDEFWKSEHVPMQ